MNPFHSIDVAALDQEWETAMAQLSKALDAYHARIQATRVAETAAGTGSWTLTLADRLLNVSPGACVMLGLDESAPFQVGQLLDSVAPAYRDRFLADWAEVASEGVRLTGRYDMTPGDKTPFTVTHHWSVVRDARGVVRQLCGVLLKEPVASSGIDSTTQP